MERDLINRKVWKVQKVRAHHKAKYPAQTWDFFYMIYRQDGTPVLHFYVCGSNDCHQLIFMHMKNSGNSKLTRHPCYRDYLKALAPANENDDDNESMEIAIDPANIDHDDDDGAITENEDPTVSQPEPKSSRARRNDSSKVNANANTSSSKVRQVKKEASQAKPARRNDSSKVDASSARPLIKLPAQRKPKKPKTNVISPADEIAGSSSSADLLKVRKRKHDGKNKVDSVKKSCTSTSSAVKLEPPNSPRKTRSQTQFGK